MHYIKKTLAAMALMACQLIAQTHFEPEEGAFSNSPFHEQNRALRRFFIDAFENDVLLRVICTPSFSHEYAIWISRDTDSAIIYYESPEQSILGFYDSVVRADSNNWRSNNGNIDEIETNKSMTRGRIAVETLDRVTFKRKIDLALAYSIFNIWQAKLLETHHSPTGNYGFGGIIYHFAARSNQLTFIEGQVWSPPDTSIIGQLINVSDYMRMYAETGDQKSINDLSNLVNRLKGQIGHKTIQNFNWEPLNRPREIDSLMSYSIRTRKISPIASAVTIINTNAGLICVISILVASCILIAISIRNSPKNAKSKSRNKA